jgi:predicted ester cyclase
VSATALPPAIGRLVSECLNARTTEKMHDIFTADYVHRWGLDGELPLATYINVMTSWFAAFPDFTVEPEMVLCGDDLVAVRYRCTATHLGPLLGREPTGREVQWRESFWYRLDADRIAEDWEDYDFAGILEQIS